MGQSLGLNDPDRQPSRLEGQTHDWSQRPEGQSSDLKRPEGHIRLEGPEGHTPGLEGYTSRLEGVSHKQSTTLT